MLDTSFLDKVRAVKLSNGIELGEYVRWIDGPRFRDRVLGEVERRMKDRREICPHAIGADLARDLEAILGDLRRALPAPASGSGRPETKT